MDKQATEVDQVDFGDQDEPEVWNADTGGWGLVYRSGYPRHSGPFTAAPWGCGR
jgi:hypothetical protein